MGPARTREAPLRMDSSLSSRLSVISLPALSRAASPGPSSAGRGGRGATGLRLVALILTIRCFLGIPGEAAAVSAPIIPPHQSPIVVEQNDAWVDFPGAVDFHLVARASAPIETASIEYGVDARTCGDVTNVASPRFEPDAALDLTWRWEVTPNQVIPPSGRIWWRWQLTTAAGQEIATPRQTIAFADDWFLWRSESEGNLTVHWYRGGTSLAQKMLTAGGDTLDQLEADTGLRLADPIAIYLYEEPLDLRRSVPGAPSWIGGIAFPAYNTVLLVADEAHLDYSRRTLRHELGHLVIERLTFNCLTDLPVWLSEGLALVAEGDPDPDLVDTLEQAVAEDRLLSIHQIESAFSIHADRATLSYAESYSLVRYLIDAYGQERMQAFLMALRDGVAPDDAALDAYGIDLRVLENDWREAVGAPPAESAGETGLLPTPIPTLPLATVPPVPLVTSSPVVGLDAPEPVTSEPLAPAGDARPQPPTGRLIWIVGPAALVVLLAAFVVLRRRR